MKAVCFKSPGNLELKMVSTPEKAKSEHIIIKMIASGINPGDNMVISGMMPASSSDKICGVSGVGKVIEIGENTPKEFNNKNVAVYTSLKVTENRGGTWSEYFQMHYLNCVILPDSIDLIEYSASLVNTITPYAFLKEIQKDGHSGIICTAGTSASGRAMLGICLTNDIPLISIVRNEEGKKELQELNAENILVQSNSNFEVDLKNLSEKLNTTAVFDGVGGELISKVAVNLPRNSTIYTYGFLDGEKHLSLHTSNILMNNLTIKGFGNFLSETVTNSAKLEIALKELSKIIKMPHFKTKVGKTYQLEEFNDALNYKSEKGEKAIFLP